MGKHSQNKPQKKDLERLVLLGLVDLYLRLDKPVGSKVLQNEGFESMSSATIRNYFGKLEKAGYLEQQHSSGGPDSNIEGISGVCPDAFGWVRADEKRRLARHTS